MRRLEYLRRAACFAWDRTMHDVIGQTGGQRVVRSLVGVTLVAVAYGYVRLVNAHSAAFSDAIKTALLTSAALLIVWTFVFLYHFLIEGPYQVALAEHSRAEDLNRKLHPNAEFDAEWHRLTASGPIRDRTDVYRAAAYMIFGDWNRDVEELSAMDQVTLVGAKLRLMTQDASDGNLVIYTKRQRHGGTYTDPGKDYWGDHHLDWAIVGDGGPTMMAKANTGANRLAETFDPLVRKSDIERLYGPDPEPGAGGAAMGYNRAGFDVVGIDINPQPHYPFEFIQADALTADNFFGIDAIHASPPCQLYTRKAANWGRERKHFTEHPDLIEATRKLLQASGKPWVLENVMGAPMRCDTMLCGTMFGLRIIKHRQFETNFPLDCLLPPCDHSDVYNPWQGKGRSAEEHRAAQGTPWIPQCGGASRKAGYTGDLNNAIPPAYTEFIGKQLLAHLRQSLAA